MTDKYTFTMYGNPLPQPRPKVSIRGGYAHAYEDRAIKFYKEQLYMVAREEFLKHPILLQGALGCHIDFYLEIPEYIAKSKKKMQLALINEIRPDKKPDIDNLVKLVLDSIGLKNYPKIIFNNDSQVVHVAASKFYSDKPRTEVTIFKIPHQND